MCDITNSNFFRKYHDILKDISSSSFIAIDCEFSGLHLDVRNTLSSFDTSAEAYDKLRRIVEGFTILQIGISAFTYCSDEKYSATTYTFYLFPRSHSCSDYDFSCSTESIQFLCNQNFDFNKVFYSGITYVNAETTEQLKRDLENGSLVQRLRTEVGFKNRQKVYEFKARVDAWRTTVEPGSSMVLDMSDLDATMVCLVWETIHDQCPDIRVTCDGWERLIVEKVAPGSARETAAKNDALLMVAMGFTRFLREVTAMKKPVIGHNMSLDMFMLYKTFIGPLPDRYDRFKTGILELFPEVYDTKYLTVILKNIMAKGIFVGNALSSLYDFFHMGKGATIVFNMPLVEYKSSSPLSKRYHDSGFDSYCTGYIFLKLAHMFSMWDEKEKDFNRFSLGNSPNRYFASVKAHKNCINLTRGHSTHIHLDGPDPARISRHFVVVEAVGRAEIDLPTVAEAIARFDVPDIKKITPRRVVIATSNKNASRCISKHFARCDNFRILNYNPEYLKRNNFKSKAFVTGILVLVSAISVYFISKA